MENEIGKIAVTEDGEFEILDVRNLGYGQLEYWLKGQNHWYPEKYIHKIKSDEKVIVGESYNFLFEGENNEYDEEYKNYIKDENSQTEK